MSLAIPIYSLRSTRLGSLGASSTTDFYVRRSKQKVHGLQDVHNRGVNLPKSRNLRTAAPVLEILEG